MKIYLSKMKTKLSANEKEIKALSGLVKSTETIVWPLQSFFELAFEWEKYQDKKESKIGKSNKKQDC